MQRKISPNTCAWLQAAPVLLLLLAASAVGPALAEPGLYARCEEGRIVRAATGVEMDFSSLAPELAEAGFVLFGERHGVRAHAEASACVLSAMAADRRPVVLVMEMLSRDDQDAIDGWRRAHPENAAGLGAELKWWQRGWPPFDSWLPLIGRAFGLRVPLYGGDLPARESQPRDLTREERTALLQRLGEGSEAILENWRAAMHAAHCGLLSPQEAERLGLHQVRRDLSIADAALVAAAGGGAVLLEVGRGHSRKDRSLHAVLASGSAGGPKSTTLSIGAFTTNEAITPADRAAHDFLWVVGEDRAAVEPCVLGDTPAKEKKP